MKVNYQATEAQLAEKEVKQQMKYDAFIQQIVNKKPSEINQFIDDNINTVADIKVFMKQMIVLIKYILNKG